MFNDKNERKKNIEPCQEQERVAVDADLDEIMGAFEKSLEWNPKLGELLAK